MVLGWMYRAALGRYFSNDGCQSAHPTPRGSCLPGHRGWYVELRLASITDLPSQSHGAPVCNIHLACLIGQSKDGWFDAEVVPSGVWWWGHRPRSTAAGSPLLHAQDMREGTSAARHVVDGGRVRELGALDCYLTQGTSNPSAGAGG